MISDGDTRRDRPPGRAEADAGHASPEREMPSGPRRDPGKRAGPAGAGEGGEGFSRAVAQQNDRRKQLRYVREFLNSPELVDLRSAPVTTSSAPHEIELRKRDLVYRLDVLDALRTLLAEELAAIDRIERESDREERQDPAA